jgi:hypothetical protein
MGVTYKPEDARRRRTKDKALKDLDPSLREPTKKIIENTAEDLKRKTTEIKRSKKKRDLKEK